VETRISDESWEYLMPREQPSDTAFAEGTPGFSGRFVGTFEDDLQTAYRRVSARRD
jgi:hypothetical protein